MGLFSNSTPTAKFAQVGDFCIGRITSIGQQQRTEYHRDGTSGQAMFWSGGRPVAGADVDPKTGQPNQPVMDHVVTVDTGHPDENGETERRIFVKGKADLASIKAACTEAGVRDIEVGGLMKKLWESGRGGVDEPRVYRYFYQPPARAGVLGDDQAPAPAPATQPDQPGAAPAGNVQAALDQMARAHASSPVLNRDSAKTATAKALGVGQVHTGNLFDGEPPF
jgi:hypothetical protein